MFIKHICIKYTYIYIASKDFVREIKLELLQAKSPKAESRSRGTRVHRSETGWVAHGKRGGACGRGERLKRNKDASER